MGNRNCVYERQAAFFPCQPLTLVCLSPFSRKVTVERRYSELGTSTEHDLFKEKSVKEGLWGQVCKAVRNSVPWIFKKTM